jgi:hypothetical protein
VVFGLYACLDHCALLFLVSPQERRAGCVISKPARPSERELFLVTEGWLMLKKEFYESIREGKRVFDCLPKEDQKNVILYTDLQMKRIGYLTSGAEIMCDENVTAMADAIADKLPGVDRDVRLRALRYVIYILQRDIAKKIEKDLRGRPARR